LLSKEILLNTYHDLFNFAKKEERRGIIHVTNFRLIFLGFHKMFSLSLPLYQIKKVSIQKGSSKRKPLLIVSLHKRVSGLKLAFGVSSEQTKLVFKDPKVIKHKLSPKILNKSNPFLTQSRQKKNHQNQKKSRSPLKR
jgi:hypothetical protein